jgi:CubicO group peptidase (beta-lactamase class C family)
MQLAERGLLRVEDPVRKYLPEIPAMADTVTIQDCLTHTSGLPPLPAKNQYRLDNILFLHASPVYGDVVEAVEIERFDGQLASKRIVRKGGRFAMIIDYADARRSTRPRRRQFRMQPPVRTAPRGSPPLRSS